MSSSAMTPTVAIVAQGAMGAGVGGRLVEKGLHVITSLAGRSEASAKRAKDAGMVPASDQECAQADYFLSIVPPSDALALAKKMSALIEPGNKKPIYVDCNAVSPPTKVEIGNAVTKSGAPFIDVGIIGLPPEPGKSPWLHASGPDAEKFRALGDFGINVNIMEGPVGAASALKMSYAGITKGTTALGAMMMLAATRNGAAAGLRAELERSQPALLPWFQRAMPAMFPKAYRFVGEMDEIADFVGEDPAAKKLYEAISEFYTRLAKDFDGPHVETDALADLLKKKN